MLYVSLPFLSIGDIFRLLNKDKHPLCQSLWESYMYIIDLQVSQVLFLCVYVCTSVLKAMHPLAISTLPR